MLQKAFNGSVPRGPSGPDRNKVVVFMASAERSERFYIGVYTCYIGFYMFYIGFHKFYIGCCCWFYVGFCWFHIGLLWVLYGFI